MGKKHENFTSGRMMTRFHAVCARLGACADGFVIAPHPPSRGNSARARQLIDGHLTIAGQRVHFGKGLGMFWQSKQLAYVNAREIHAFGWLDDLAHLGNGKAREMAQKLVWSWIYLYRNGSGVGWEPALMGQRVIACINHAEFLLHKQDKASRDLFFAFLYQQVRYLRWHWRKSSDPYGRLAALGGVIYGGVFLKRMGYVRKGALKHFGNECRKTITDDGRVAKRNCDNFLEIFTLIVWVKNALERRNTNIPAPISRALLKMAESLRILRQADASLPRFHGAISTQPNGWLDKILSHNAPEQHPERSETMGFHCFKSGRVSFAIDAALPPAKKSTEDADYASILAFQLNTAHQPIVISAPLTPRPEKKDALNIPAPSSHSSLYINEIDGVAFTAKKNMRKKMLHSHYVSHESWRAERANSFLGHHTVLTSKYGISHSRQIDLSFDCSEIAGQDIVSAFSHKNEMDIESYFVNMPNVGVDFSLRFNIHPDIDVFYDGDISAICLQMHSGEVWLFRAAGHAHIALEDAAFFDPETLEESPHKQIMLTASLKKAEHTKILGWEFTKHSS